MFHIFVTAVLYAVSCYINGLVQERWNSSALAMELHFSCANPSISVRIMKASDCLIWHPSTSTIHSTMTRTRSFCVFLFSVYLQPCFLCNQHDQSRRYAQTTPWPGPRLQRKKKSILFNKGVLTWLLIGCATSQSQVRFENFVNQYWNFLVIQTPSGPVYKHGLSLILKWRSNHMPSNVWDEINYPFPNLGMDK